MSTQQTWSAPVSSGMCGELGQQARGDAVESPDMPEREAPQERPHRGGPPDAGEQPVPPAMPQQVHVIDGVGAGDHPGDQRRDLQVRIRAAPRRQRELRGDKLRQSAALGENDHRRKPGA